jgi:hypothetical protein
MKLALAGLLVAVGAGSVAAQARPLVSPQGGSIVIIWRNEQARSEGIALIDAGTAKANPALLYPLAACLAKVGDQVVVTNGGSFSSNVTVTTGKDAGCRGTVANDYFAQRGQTATSPPKSYPPPDCRKPTDQWTGEKCVRAK